MKKLILLVLLTVFFVGSANAESHKVGPYPNYKGTVETTVGIIIPTTVDFYINDPFGGTYHVAGMGGQEFEVTYLTPLFAHSYAEFESEEGSPFNPETGTLILTEIWAKDLEPGGEPNVVPPTEGFDPQDPKVTPSGAGFFTGRSGTQYPATVLTVTVGELPTVLSGYDVEMIIGDLTNVVYVAQATVPAAEFIIEEPSPYFLVDSQEEWQSRLDEEWPDVHIRGLTQEEGDAYLLKLEDDLEEGEPYSPIEPELPEFVPPELYVYEGDEANPDEPNDAGLVMVWGDGNTPDGERASAWGFVYGDPDLSNCIITVTASPPGPSGINRISLGMQDINGNIRSWWWNVPSVIPYSPPGPGTTITIDTTMTGLTATNPTASGFANSAAFDLTKVASIIADENANLMGGVPAPAPGGSTPAVWNYWHNLSVTPKLPGGGANSKWYVKWSRPPVEISPGLIDGWDERSLYDHQPDPIMADDWECSDNRPITDIHWWGSFIGWTQPHLPPILPSAFHIGIWTDVPDSTPGSPGDGSWSHPGTLIWENVCTTAVWNFAGYDLDPRKGDPEYQENEACFQWAQFLSQDEWFRQEPMADETPNIYWLSISAIYPVGTDFESTDFYPWGWKTRPHENPPPDDAVRIKQTSTGIWPPVIGSTLTMTDCEPIELLVDDVIESWDLSFELTTNEPAYVDEPIPGDIGGTGTLIPDGTVDFYDLAIMAGNWLNSVTP